MYVIVNYTYWQKFWSLGHSPCHLPPPHPCYLETFDFLWKIASYNILYIDIRVDIPEE